MYNDKLVYKVVVSVLGVILWKEKEVLCGAR